MTIDDEDDELEWELWMEMSDEQHEAIINGEMAKLQHKLDAMTIQQQVAHHRHFNLISILENRRRLRDPKLNRIEIINSI